MTDDAPDAAESEAPATPGAASSGADPGPATANADATSTETTGDKAAGLPAAKVVRDKLRDKPATDKPATDKPASADKPSGADKPAGADKRASADKPATADKPRAKGGQVEVELEVSRRRSIAWTIFGLIVGGLLIWKLGTVGVWGGIALVATGAYHAWNLMQTFLYPAGTIIVSDREVSLPRGLCMPRPVVAKPQDVTAVYFLRRSVPWNHAAPVLIVELGARAMAFPRDWFASEADQRHIIHALLRDKAAAPSSESA